MIITKQRIKNLEELMNKAPYEIRNKNILDELLLIIKQQDYNIKCLEERVDYLSNRIKSINKGELYD